LICITGTPGTGKSSLIALLRSRGYEVHEMIDIANDCVDGTEENEKLIDTDCLGRLRVDGIVASHLSHYLKCDLVIVLRSHLHDVEDRLSKRGYAKKKIMDNVEAEAIDLIGAEAEELHPGRVFEVLNENIDDTVAIVENIIKGKLEDKDKIDLLMEMMDWF
jgi:adenylate kinase